jgi:hypothetical protein
MNSSRGQYMRLMRKAAYAYVQSQRVNKRHKYWCNRYMRLMRRALAAAKLVPHEEKYSFRYFVKERKEHRDIAHLWLEVLNK